MTAQATNTGAQQAKTTVEGAQARETGFRAVTGGGETTSGVVLLVEAYAVFWLLAFWLIIASMRKQRQLDRRISQLGDDLAQARERASEESAEAG